MISPRDLLNRWIQPLDQHVDFLTLASGTKFQVPFELMLVFSTNLDPNDLVITRIFANEARMLKRWRARAHGRVSPQLSRSSHITVVVDERSAR